MTDLVLAIAHHLVVFTLAGLLLAEIAILGPGLGGDRLRRLGAVDLGYGIVAGLVVIVGVLRVLYGAAGPDYYVHNAMFWLKMAAFALVGILSIPPTLAILGWRKALAADPGFIPEAAKVRGLRKFYIAELIVFAFIPAFAAAMARGYGV